MGGLDLEAADRLLHAVGRLVRALSAVAATAFRYIVVRDRSSRSLAAENLFLRKQLALFQEREIKPRRADDATRAALVWLSRAFDWREALVVVKLATLIRWHRKGFRLIWKLKSRPGRPALPRDLRALIRQMAVENRTWADSHDAGEIAYGECHLRADDRHDPPRMPRLFDPARRAAPVQDPCGVDQPLQRSEAA
jgi:putative transposase